MKDKSKVLKTYGYMFDKVQFICLIGGRGNWGGGFLTRGSSRLEHLLIVTKRL